MGLKTDSSLVDVRLSKMEAAIENIAFFVAVSNLAMNQLMERKAAMTITAKATSTEEPKWTTVMAKNMRTRWLAGLWRPWLTHPNRKSASSTCNSWASKPKRARLRRSWCNGSTQSYYRAK